MHTPGHALVGSGRALRKVPGDSESRTGRPWQWPTLSSRERTLAEGGHFFGAQTPWQARLTNAPSPSRGQFETCRSVDHSQGPKQPVNILYQHSATRKVPQMDEGPPSENRDESRRSKTDGEWDGDQHPSSGLNRPSETDSETVVPCTPDSSQIRSKRPRSHKVVVSPKPRQ
ncbi:unnamed protein product [Protopolystoma xenopodis]|uniref:Uncharacterized protein n=1 Tax=Protopolystoma xenopodis TaxID=117903 RepID=A0A3S5FCP4_9PLAT|nr:unnamed protein product [Protopolystoma xenopodis]